MIRHMDDATAARQPPPTSAAWLAPASNNTSRHGASRAARLDAQVARARRDASRFALRMRAR
jgi:hypothetical protein